MPEIVPVAPQDIMPTVRLHGAAFRRLIEIAEDGTITTYDAGGWAVELWPVKALVVMRHEMQRALVPAGPDLAAKAGAMLLGCYRDVPLQDEAVFARSLAEDLSEFPPLVLNEMVVEIRRTCKFFPTIAECFQCCKRRLAYRHAQVRLIESMLAEHERRAEEKRRDEEHSRAESERLSARRAKHIEVFGPELAPDAKTLSHGESGMREALGWARFKDWDQALDAGDGCTLAALVRASVLARAIELDRRNVLSWSQVATVAELVWRDYPAALEFVESAEAGKIGREFVGGSHGLALGRGEIWEHFARRLAVAPEPAAPLSPETLRSALAMPVAEPGPQYDEHEQEAATFTEYEPEPDATDEQGDDHWWEGDGQELLE